MSEETENKIKRMTGSMNVASKLNYMMGLDDVEATETEE